MAIYSMDTDHPPDETTCEIDDIDMTHYCTVWHTQHNFLLSVSGKSHLYHLFTTVYNAFE